MASWEFDSGPIDWEAKLLVDAPFAEWRRIAAVSKQWLIDMSMPDYMSVEDKARACVNYDRRLDEIAKSRRAR